MFVSHALNACVSKATWLLSLTRRPDTQMTHIQVQNWKKCVNYVQQQ